MDITYGADEAICFYSLGGRYVLGPAPQAWKTPTFRQGFRRLYHASRALDANLFRSRADIYHVREAFQANTTDAGVVIRRWYDGTEPYDLSHLDHSPVDPNLTNLNGRVEDAFIHLDEDRETRTVRFSAKDVDEWAYIRLITTFPSLIGPKEQSFDFVQFYDDGFAFRRWTHGWTLEPDTISLGGSFTVFWKSSEWATGRYWVYVYDGERKVAEVTYEVTP